MISKLHTKVALLPVLAIIVSLLSLGILLFTSAPPPEGVQSLYKIRIIFFWIISSLVLISFLYLLGDGFYFLFKKQYLKSIGSFFGIFLIGFGSLMTFYLLGTGAGFSEIESVNFNDASYRLIQIGDPDGFPIHYALCECDLKATKCACHLIHTRVFGNVESALEINESSMTVLATFEDDLVCQYSIPLKFTSPLSSYSGYAFFECRDENYR
jgi:hypothetical protein